MRKECRGSSGWMKRAMAAVLILGGTLYAFGASSIELTVTEGDGVDRVWEPVTTGVPFGKGLLKAKDVSAITVVDANRRPLPCQFRAISSWPDGSVRWVLMDTQVSIKANQSMKLNVIPGRAGVPRSPVKTTEKDGALWVTTGPLVFSINKTNFNIFETLKVNGKEVITKDSPGLVLYPGADAVAAKGAPKEFKVEEEGPMRTVILVRGEYPGVHNGLLTYTVRITAYAGQPFLNLRVWLENNGKYGYTRGAEWYKFDGQAIEFDLNMGRLNTLLVEGEKVAIDNPAAPKFKVAQHNTSRTWDGFKYTISSGGKEVGTGARTGGLTSIGGVSGKITVGVRYFWENYSKAIELDGKRLKIWLWPTDGSWPPTEGRWGNRGGGDFMEYRQAGVYHIPGGVRKGHELVLDFAGRDPKCTRALLRSPLMAMAAPAYYSETEAAPGWFAPADFKSGDAAYDQAADFWDKQALDAVNEKSGSSIANARKGNGYVVRNWYGWMDFGDNGWGGGMSSLHYDWSWIMLINSLRHGNRAFFDVGVTMVRHLMEVDHLWTDRNHPMLRRMARYEFANPFIHGGVADGRAKPNPSHNWVSGIVLYYMLTGDQFAYECAMSNDKGVTLRTVEPFKANPNSGGQARETGWAILSFCSLYDLTGDKVFLDKGLSLFQNNLKLKWKEKGTYHDGGLQYYYGTQGLCELQHRSDDPEIMKMLEEGAKGDFNDQYAEWRVFLSNVCAYVGYKKKDPELIKKAKSLFEAYKPRGTPTCYTGSGAWDKESGKYMRNGHILQYVLWKTKK